MINFIKTISILLIFFSVCNSQISQNTSLFKNLNPRPNQPPSIFGSIYAACWGWTAPNGREYALLGCVTGTSFIDITDSLNVTERDFVPGPNEPWREMKTYLNYAYLVTDGSGVGMQIIDLQYLPDSVRHIRNWTFSGFTRAHTISQNGRFLYLNGGDASPNGGIRVVDLLDPVNPVIRGTYTQSYIHDCFIRNDTIFAAALSLTENKYVIINAINKDNLTVITEFSNLPNYFYNHNCWVTDDRKYLITTDELSNPPGTVKIWNIQNLSNITYVTSYRPPNNNTSIAHNVIIKGNLLIVSHYTAGIRFVNISNPAQPVEIGYYDTYPNSDSSVYRGNWGSYPFFTSGKFVSSDMQTGLWVVKLLSTPIGINNNNNIIKEFELLQNYPNPFNPSTTIKYKLAVKSYVTLKVFDIKGTEVINLVNQEQQLGEYNVIFSGKNLSSGIYFYKLEASSGNSGGIKYSDTKKMMFIK
ncbi:MAG: choice-of-anchor B family protein [Ignavibacteria bacterium]